MTTIRDLLRSKGRDVWSVAPEASVFDALKLMADKDIGAVLVLDGDRLAGILSERDYARKVALKGQTSRDTPVAKIMTEQVVCVTPDTSIEECMALMSAQHIRHLPVLDGDRLIGIISIGDVVKAMISAQGFVIEQLENYIHGGRR